jgi:hypothetical protein
MDGMISFQLLPRPTARQNDVGLASGREGLFLFADGKIGYYPHVKAGIHKINFHKNLNLFYLGGRKKQVKVEEVWKCYK